MQPNVTKTQLRFTLQAQSDPNSDSDSDPESGLKASVANSVPVALGLRERGKKFMLLPAALDEQQIKH